MEKGNDTGVSPNSKRFRRLCLASKDSATEIIIKVRQVQHLADRRLRLTLIGHWRQAGCKKLASTTSQCSSTLTFQTRNST